MAGNSIGMVGTVTADEMVTVQGRDGVKIMEEGIHKLKTAWQNTLKF